MGNKFVPDIEMWNIEKVLPYEANAKIHTQDQIDRLARQITKTGWDVPIVVDSGGVIIKGHGRRLAAIKMGMKRVPVIVRRDLSQKDIDAARLADNRVAIGDFDTVLLQAELAKLAEGEYDLGSIGFDEKELSFLTEDPILDLNSGAFAEPGDEAPEGGAPLEDGDVAVAKAMGFSHVRKQDLPAIKNFMAKISFELDLPAGDAFIEYCKSAMSD